jgi:CubicO group peptidase (beta-lactamase class C family)
VRRISLALIPLSLSLGTGCPRGQDETPVAPAPAGASTDDADPELAAALARIDRIVDNKRRELHIPGVALAIVKDGKVIHARGYGYRDLQQKLPVTADTQFAIGSATKAFTALGTLLAVEAGKISLGDSPKKCVPYFSLKDPEADANITIEHLLTHSSGLGRTDESWVFGDLTLEETIRIAGLAKPLVKLGEAFNYQNAMYTTAGVCAANALETDYRDLIRDRIFAPLGMTGADMTLEAFAAAEHALGYEIRNDEDGEPAGVIPAWLMDVGSQAPAGAINASVTDMAKWLQFVLDRGETQALASAESMETFLTPHMEIADEGHYALGWFVDEWRNKDKVHHGGNVAGFSAMVAMLPKKDIGYVMLTNLSATPLAATIDDAVFSLALPRKGAGQLRERTDPGDPSQKDYGAERPPAEEVGTYELGSDPATMLKAAVKLVDDHLQLSIPGQPAYALTRVEGRRYKFTPPESPRAFYVTFRPNASDETKQEGYIEQPGGAAVIHKVDDDPAAGLAAVEPPTQKPDAMKDLLGIYEAPEARIGLSPRIERKDGHIVVTGIGGLQGFVLSPQSDTDQYGLHGAPGVTLIVRRSEDGAVDGFKIDVQGKQKIRFDRVGDLPPELPLPKITIEKLMAKVAKANGAAKLAKHPTIRIQAHTVREHEGMEVDVVGYQAAPDKASSRRSFKALGREIMQTGEIFDGENGYVELGKYPPRKLRGRELTDLRVASAFNPTVNYTSIFESVGLVRMTKLDGRKAYVIEQRPTEGSVITLYVDAKTLRVVRRDVRPLGSSAVNEVYYEDFRKVDGVTFPFRITSGTGATRAVTEVESIELGVDLPADAFQPRGKLDDPEPLDVVDAGSPGMPALED